MRFWSLGSFLPLIEKIKTMTSEMSPTPRGDRTGRIVPLL
jgi:hypothetical protein